MSKRPTNTQLSRAHRPAVITLGGIVLAYIAFNAVATVFFQTHPPKHDELLAFTVGIYVFEPMSFGLWLALGFGAWMTRLPMIVTSLGIVIVAAAFAISDFGDMKQIDFVAVVLSGTAIFVVSSLIFLGLRWLAWLRFETLQLSGIAYRPYVRFDVKYLLTLTTLVAAALGMASQLNFHPPPRYQFLGPDFVLYVMIYGGAMVAAVSLPMIAVSLFVLSPSVSKRAVSFAIGFWFFVVALASSLIWVLSENDSWPEIIEAVLLTQLGAGIAGALTALPLRLAGLRLVKRRAGASPSS